MYQWLINLFTTLQITNLELTLSNHTITIYTKEILALLITLLLIGGTIYLLTKLMLLPNKALHQWYHKFAKKRGIKTK